MNYINFIESIGSCVHNAILYYGLFISLFMAGLLGSFTHCLPMCGVFVLSQTNGFTKLKDLAIIPYHLGRITTYVTLAILFSSVLNLIYLFLPIKMLIIAPILSTAAILFLVNAFPNLRKILPFTDYIKLPIPQKWLSYNKIHTLKPYFMGVMLGFMPCGLVLSALLITSTASTPYESALAMASFGIGTMPALILIAIGSKVVKQKYAHINYTFTRTLTVISSLWLCVTVGIILKGLQ